MSKVFRCDICKRRITDNEEVGSFSLRGVDPSALYLGRGRSGGKRYSKNRRLYKQMDLCPSCTAAIHRAINDIQEAGLYQDAA